jgi:hypothetical protein
LRLRGVIQHNNTRGFDRVTPLPWEANSTGAKSEFATSKRNQSRCKMKFVFKRALRFLFVAWLVGFSLLAAVPVCSQTPDYEFNDSHFHLTNNIQEGPNIRDFLKMPGLQWSIRMQVIRRLALTR